MTPTRDSNYESTNRTQVNPEIRGGLVVEIGDRTIDLSVSSKLAKMNKLLSDAL
jgi:F-type H+-transporting ATPase subunit O